MSKPHVCRDHPDNSCIEDAIRMICEAFPNTTVIHDHYDNLEESESDQAA